MKKYLMTGIAALAIGGTFTSCGPDMSSYSGNPTEQVVQNYENKFVQAFGEPAPNQTWGFGSSTATVAATRGMTRSVGTYADYRGHLEPSFPNWSTFQSFPSDCDASKFLAAVPSGVDKLPANGDTNGGTYYIDATTTKVNMYNTAGVIYVSGTVDLSSDNKFEVKENTEIYLIKDSKLLLGTNDANKLKAIIYIESSARLETANRLKMDNTSKVYNHGTIKVGAFEVNNTSFLYNVGTLESDGLVYVANNNSSIVNDGTIIAGDVKVEGSGHVQNNAEWTVKVIGSSTGTTTVNSNSASWVNNGHWTTDNYKYTAGSDNVINNCYLEVKNDFDMNLGSTGSFRMDAGAGVLTKNFNGGKNDYGTSGPYKVTMGQGSVFRVTDTATLDGGNKGWGFFGPESGGYAVFQAKDVKRGRDHSQGMVTYGGNLYVSAETHFTNDDQYNPSIYFEAPFTISNIYAAGDNNFSTGNPDITIPTTPCNPGFGGGGSDNTESIRVIGEDLTINSNSDFDFNDIVFDVIRKNGKIYVKFLAAGGELPIYIGPDNNSAWELHGLFADKEKEVAEKGGKTARNITTKTMMNTRAGKHQEYPCPELELPSGWWDSSKTEISDIANSIEIRVQKSGTLFVLKAPKGEAPSKIAVYTDYVWCDETDNINDIYNGNFKKYVEGESGYEWNKWYNK